MNKSAPANPGENAKPLLVVLSGPSGVGKDALLSRMRELNRPYHFTVTATTRPKRTGEEDGRDYIFVSEERFLQMVLGDELLEHALVYDNYYGVPCDQVRQALERGQDVIVKTDVQGAATIRSKVPQAVFIFLAPPSMEELERRLRERKTESPSVLELRIETAREEMKHEPTFDYVVVNHNDRLDEAVAEVEAIVTSEKRRISPRRVKI